MATQVQFRGGTTTEHASFNGAAREVTVDTTKQTLVVQDGSTNGGFPLLGEKNADNITLNLGTGNDLQLYHNGANSRIVNTHAGQFSIGSDITAFTNAAISEDLAKFTANGAAELYWDGSKKLHTNSAGIEVFGNTYQADDGISHYGSGNDLKIYHDANNSYIWHNGTGNLRIFSGAAESIRCTADGTTQLFHNGTEMMYTHNAGIKLNDNKKIYLGTSADLQIYHDGSDSIITDMGTGVLKISGSAGVYINKYDNVETCAAFLHDSAVELYFDNNKKFETTSEGTATTGRATIAYAGNAGKPTLTLGADNSQGSTSLTNSTSKGARLGVYHYTNAEEPAAILYAVGSDTTNQVNYGGGTSWMNAATHHKFFTADDITTASGTEKLRIDGNGRVSINTDTPHCANKGVHIKTGDSGVTSASTNRDDIFIEGSDHSGITISTANNKTGGIGFDDPDGAGRGRIQYSHSSDKMQIYTSGTNSFEFTDDLDILDGDLRVANGHGINFSSTSHVTGVESELLDDYESGTWTADVVTGTCSQQSCNYVKIGSLVQIWGRIHGLSDTTTNIILKITGLPYTCSTSNAGGGKFSKDISTDANTAYITTAEDLTFYGHNTANAWSYVTHLSCGSNTEIYFHASYTSDTN